MRKIIFCLMLPIFISSGWSSDKLELNDFKVQKVKITRNLKHLGVLPENKPIIHTVQTLMYIYKSGKSLPENVCRDCEPRECIKEILVSCKIKSEEDFVGGLLLKSFNPSHLSFKYIPTVETLKKAAKFSNLVYLKIRPKKQTNDVKTKEKNLEDLSMFDSIHTLDLVSNRGLNDLPMPKNVHTLDMWGSGIKDVSRFGKVHTLCLNSTLVEDVSRLGNVHTLILAGTKVKDVSMLGKVHILDIRETQVKDISALGGVNTLYLSTTDLIGFENLKTVKNLYIWHERYIWPK